MLQKTFPAVLSGRNFRAFCARTKVAINFISNRGINRGINHGETVQNAGAQVRCAVHHRIRNDRPENTQGAGLHDGHRNPTTTAVAPGARAPIRREKRHAPWAGPRGRGLCGCALAQRAFRAHARPGQIQHRALYARFHARDAKFYHGVSVHIHTQVCGWMFDYFVLYLYFHPGGRA